MRALAAVILLASMSAQACGFRASLGGVHMPITWSGYQQIPFSEAWREPGNHFDGRWFTPPAGKVMFSVTMWLRNVAPGTYVIKVERFSGGQYKGDIAAAICVPGNPGTAVCTLPIAYEPTDGTISYALFLYAPALAYVPVDPPTIDGDRAHTNFSGACVK